MLVERPLLAVLGNGSDFDFGENAEEDLGGEPI